MSYQVTGEQFREERTSAARVQRADVYKRLLTASASVVTEQAAVSARCRPTLTAIPTFLTGGLFPVVYSTPNTRCANAYGAAFRSAEERYRRAAADVFVYGSDHAYAAERALAELIVPDIRGVGTPPVSSKRTAARLVKDGRWTREKAADFERAYIVFQRVMCRELSAQPRAGCSGS